jgi:membrane-associated phospholipid phosphatase
VSSWCHLARRTTLLTVSYLGTTAALIVMFGRDVPRWPLLVAAHLAFATALMMLRRHDSPRPILQVVLDWHPILLFPVLYKEVDLLAPAIGNWELTNVIPLIEARLFTGQPSLYLSERLRFVALSELLHFCYLSYVIVIPAVCGYWYAVGRRVAFHELVLLLALVMFGSYLFFILFPVDSPYYRSERLGSPLAGHFFFDLVHKISDRGGARGGAFPSAHVSGAIVVVLMAWRHQRRLAYLLAPIVIGVMVATVYGRFHYALDTIAGLALGVAAVSIYPKLWADSCELTRQGAAGRLDRRE